MPQPAQSPIAPPKCDDQNGNTRKLKPASYELFEVTMEGLKKTRDRVLAETIGQYVGPMPIHKFFDVFMPWNEETPISYKQRTPPKDRRDMIVRFPSCSEPELYQNFVNAFNGWHGICRWKNMPNDIGPGLEFKDSHKYHDKDCLSQSVDISVYSGVPFVPRQNRQTMDFANLHCWIEIKPNEGYDAFDDGEPNNEEVEDMTVEDSVQDEEDSEDIQDQGAEVLYVSPEMDIATDGIEAREFEAEGDEQELHVEDLYPEDSQSFPFEKNTTKGCDTRAQLASYAGATMAMQYRNHLLTVLIVGMKARFIKWDRSSAVVTRSFDITKEPLLLFEFFKRLRQLTLSQRGSNPNVQPATKKEAQLARDHLKNMAPELWLGLAGQEFLKNIDIATQPFLKLNFQHHTFIVPAPHCNERGLSPFGRCSRSCAAVQLNHDGQHRVCYIKDSWRNPRRISESDIYTKLEDAGVSNIAGKICGGDWGVSTMGNMFTSKRWVRKESKLKIRDLSLSVLVLDTIGRSLVAFRKAYDLIGGLADAMQAYEEALEKAHIMHRDISPNNILLVPNGGKSWKGILIDWDHAFEKDVKSENSLACRAGTWQFMSVRLLKNDQAKHTPSDDRESAFYVLLWICLRHLKHNLDAKQLARYLNSFDYTVVYDGTHMGGELKMAMLGSWGRECLPIKLNIEPITDLLQDLVDRVAERYNSPRFSKSNPKYNDLMEERRESIAQTLENPHWFVNALRDAREKLPKPKKGDAPDWVDNITDILNRGPRISLLCQTSHMYDAYTLKSSDHERVTPANEIGSCGSNNSDPEPLSKRARTKTN